MCKLNLVFCKAKKRAVHKNGIFASILLSVFSPSWVQKKKWRLFVCLLGFAVPPNIDDSLSSSDAIVREGANVTLTCRATGSPTPNIKWKRDDNSLITINKTLSCKRDSAFPSFFFLFFFVKNFTEKCRNKNV